MSYKLNVSLSHICCVVCFIEWIAGARVSVLQIFKGRTKMVIQQLVSIVTRFILKKIDNFFGF